MNADRQVQWLHPTLHPALHPRDKEHAPGRAPPRDAVRLSSGEPGDLCARRLEEGVRADVEPALGEGGAGEWGMSRRGGKRAGGWVCCSGGGMPGSEEEGWSSCG